MCARCFKSSLVRLVLPHLDEKNYFEIKINLAKKKKKGKKSIKIFHIVFVHAKRGERNFHVSFLHILHFNMDTRRTRTWIATT